jgi:hypothetical protein
MLGSGVLLWAWLFFRALQTSWGRPAGEHTKMLVDQGPVPRCLKCSKSADSLDLSPKEPGNVSSWPAGGWNLVPLQHLCYVNAALMLKTCPGGNSVWPSL